MVSPPRRPAPSGSHRRGVVDARKHEQARRATEAGPPAGFAPVEPDPDPVEQPAPVPSAGRPVITLGGGPDLSDGGGFVLGLIAYALALAYIRHGRDGVVGWFKAKFINEPSTFPSEPVPGNISRHGVTA